MRWLQFLVVTAGALPLVQAAILSLTEPAARRRFAAVLRAPAASGAVEQRVIAWRKRRRRQLWINVVVVPCLILLGLVLVGEYG